MVKLGKFFIVHDSGLVEFRTPNTRKGFFLQMIAAFGLFCMLMDIPFMFSGKSFLKLFYEDYYIALFAWLFHSLAVGSAILWIVTHPSKVFLDRTKKEVVLDSGKERLRFPWSTIRFESNWVPTKIGGVQLLSIKAVPPFPEGLMEKLSSKAKAAKSTAGNVFVPLGSVDCRNGDEARSFIRFMSGLMESDRSAMEIFQGRT